MAAKKKKKARARKSRRIIVRGAQVVTLDDNDRIEQLDIVIEEGRVAKLAARQRCVSGDQVIDAKGLVVMPGFVQIHVHMCQALFRGQADDMQLLDWLQQRVWPLEASLESTQMRASARFALSELLLGGTTSVLDMGSVHHTDVLFDEAQRFGMRYTGGKTIMDRGQAFPANLRESADEAITESCRLADKWHGAAQGRLRYAFSPRFILCCSDEVMSRCAEEARRRGALLHTHASENSEEVQLIRERTGKGNVEALHDMGFLGPTTILAHGVWLSAKERAMLRKTGTHIAHCPSANLKLASGIARIDELLAMGINVGLGADGSACNNRLDAFTEMRLAALLHKVRGGPQAIPARRALRMATIDGAKALGLADVGMIREGYKADLVVLDLNMPHTYPPAGDLISSIVYAATPANVHSVIADGRLVAQDHGLVEQDLEKILAGAKRAAAALAKKVN